MKPLRRDDLFTLEHYARIRAQYRAGIIEHKKNRRLPIGEHAALYFEDRLTMQYQVQEMLRIEKIFEEEGIAEELRVYNALIPDGHNWKATFMMEYADERERRSALAALIGIEHLVWVQIDGHERVRAIANEDLPRSNDDKTASVHFMRFELTPSMVDAAKAGAAIDAGIDHERYRHQVRVPQNVRDALALDLD